MSEPRKTLAVTTRIVVIAGVLALGGAVFGVLQMTAPTLEQASPDAMRRTVVTFTPQIRQVSRQWRGYGQVLAKRSADVPARITATVVKLPDDADEGMSVTQGQLLARLDESDFVAEASRLVASLAQIDASLAEWEVTNRQLKRQLELEQDDLQIASDELARVRKLFEGRVTNPQDVDRARSAELAARRAMVRTQEQIESMPSRREGLLAQKAALEAQLQIARLNVERASITSPITGVVQQIDPHVGEIVAAGQRVARIVDDTLIEVTVQLPTAARRSIAVGSEVQLVATNGSQRRWTATVSRISPEDDPQTRTLTMYAELEQSDVPPQERLSPGRFVEALVTGRLAEPRVVIPRRSLRKQRVQQVMIDDQGQSFIQSRETPISFSLEGTLPDTGLEDDQWAVLQDDTLAGKPILLTATTVVLDGERVTVRELPMADGGSGIGGRGSASN